MLATGRIRSGGGAGRTWLLYGIGVLTILGPLLLIVRGWRQDADTESASRRSLGADELRALPSGADGDARLLAHLRRRVAPGSGGRALPPAASVPYATLRMEELARTDGWALGLAATPSPDGEVAAEEAAAAYEALAQAEAAGLMRRLQPLVAAERLRWQAYREAGGGAAPPPGHGFGDLAQRLDGLLPAVRAARRAWAVAHADELAQP